MRTAILFLAGILAVTTALSSCTTLTVTTPEGFAEVRQEDSYTAISPEGVKYRVRKVENYPQKNLQFWGDALKQHLSRKGYIQIGNGKPFTADGKEGISFEWGLPYGNENYIYLTGIVVYPKYILIAEAAGEAARFREYEESLRSSLEGISLE